MKYYCNPLNIEYRYQFVKHPRQGDVKATIYREAADPSIVLFKDVYYMFPSMTAGFLTSDDLTDWKFNNFKSDMPVYDYAPDVRVVGDYIYFSASKSGGICNFYRSKDPVNEPFEEIPGSFTFWDPNLFLDDDGKLYFYWGCSNMTPIYGVELEPETMKPKTEPIVLFGANNETIGYERIGDDHICPKTKEQIKEQAEAMVAQMMAAPFEARKAHGFESEEAVRRVAYSVMGDAPYIEGAWMTKYNGKYYLQYAAPGTQYNVYADGVYVSDEPLSNFKLAKNNPYSYKPGGFINGAGHGSTVQDKQGDYWHTSTMSISKNDDMERRVGLWKAGFDTDGELYCDQRYGDWPVALSAPAFAKPDFMLLSYGKAVNVSSGTGAEHVTDENVRTWWKAGSNKPGEWVELDLGKNYDVRAIQINFADEGIKTEMPEGGVITYDERFIDTHIQKTRWKLEHAPENGNYSVLVDKTGAESDLSHDFLLFEEEINVSKLRLTITELPHFQTPCISGIRVFGYGKSQPPKVAENVSVDRADDLNMDITWEAPDATGVNILWGFTPDKLYHSYMVFGKNRQRIGALIKGEPVFIRVDSFNESGITEGATLEVH